MPGTSISTAAHGSTLGAALNRPKYANVSAASNGFVISLANTSDHNQTIKIAATPEDVAIIISEYFQAE